MTDLNVLMNDIRNARAAAFPRNGEDLPGSEGMTAAQKDEARAEAKAHFEAMIPQAVEGLAAAIQDRSHWDRNALIEGICFKFHNRRQWLSDKFATAKRHVEEADARIEAALSANETPEAAILSDFDASVQAAKRFREQLDSVEESYLQATALYEAVTNQPFTPPKRTASTAKVTKADINALRKEAAKL